jgi:hypothetical protein
MNLIIVILKITITLKIQTILDITNCIPILNNVKNKQFATQPLLPLM